MRELRPPWKSLFYTPIIITITQNCDISWNSHQVSYQGTQQFGDHEMVCVCLRRWTYFNSIQLFFPSRSRVVVALCGCNASCGKQKNARSNIELAKVCSADISNITYCIFQKERTKSENHEQRLEGHYFWWIIWYWAEILWSTYKKAEKLEAKPIRRNNCNCSVSCPIISSFVNDNTMHCTDTFSTPFYHDIKHTSMAPTQNAVVTSLKNST